MTHGRAHQRQAHQRRRRRWWVPPMVIGLTLLAVAVWGIVVDQPRLPGAGPAPAWAGTARAASAPSSAATPPATTPPATRPAVVAAPAMPAVLPMGAQSISIPSLQVSAPASPESAAAGGLGVPGDPHDVGWWMPTTSELVIDGHVDMEGVGPGALYEVRNLRPGAQVTVQTTAGPEHWKIDGVRTYTKGRVPDGLFKWQGSSGRLIIITCGGPFDYATHHYADNVVAYGSPSQG